MDHTFLVSQINKETKKKLQKNSESCLILKNSKSRKFNNLMRIWMILIEIGKYFNDFKNNIIERKTNLISKKQFH